MVDDDGAGRGAIAEVQLRRAGEFGLLIEVPEDEVQGVTAWLVESEWAPRIEDIVPSHTTVLVMARERLDDIAAAARLRPWGVNSQARSAKSVTIPVVYGGPDFDEVCRTTGLTGDELARLHSETVHVVSHFGFSPGFPYLRGLPEALHVPRRSDPRPLIEKNSVAIAAGLTVIYPGGTPGGWNLIGRAQAPSFWDADRTPPNLLSLGDRIVFRESS